MKRLLFLLLPVAALGSDLQVQRQLDAPVLVVELHLDGKMQQISMGYSGSLPDSMVLVLSGPTEERRVYFGRLDTVAVAR